MTPKNSNPRRKQESPILTRCISMGPARWTDENYNPPRKRGNSSRPSLTHSGYENNSKHGHEHIFISSPSRTLYEPRSNDRRKNAYRFAFSILHFFRGFPLAIPGLRGGLQE